MLNLIIGFVVGSICGALAMSLITAARDEEDRNDY